MKNWEKVKLGTLLTESKIISQNPNPDNRIRVKLNLMGIEKRPLTKDKKGATKYYIRKAGQFIYGKFLDSLIIGIIAFIGLAILKVKFFPILAVFILITNMIPYFGPFIGGFPAVLVALMTGDLFHALAVLVFVFALQQFDGLFLGPKILGDVVGISPFWVLLSITVFGHFFGFIGMFIGVPMICVIRMLFNDIIDFRNKMKELDT